ncbi:MAG: hypothetical protein ABII79_09045 [bacterium]
MRRGYFLSNVKARNITVIALLLMILTSCGGGEGQGVFSSGGGGTSLVTLTVGGGGKTANLKIEKNTLLARAKRFFKDLIQTDAALAAIPANVATIVFTISASDMATIAKTVVAAGQASITETFTVPNGSNRAFLVEAKNAEALVIYRGSTTVDLNGGAVTLNITMEPLATITGTVAGTVIVAIDQNNNEVTRNTAAGTPKRFTITVPIGGTYRFYFIENEDTISENIFPLYWQGSTNKFSITSASTIDMGFVDTSIGVAIPANDPLIVSGVSSAENDHSIPIILISATPPTGASLSSLVATGLTFLSHGSILKAKAYFKAAVENYPNDTTNDGGDTARVFYALTRVVGVNMYSDGNPGDLNSVGDIIDLNGCSRGGRGFSSSTVVCPALVPYGFPSGSEIKNFMYNVIKPELEGAIANLDAVHSSFNKTWTEPFFGVSYKSDYGDVLFLKALIKAALAEILIQDAYNLDADIYATDNSQDTYESFLSNPDNIEFLTLSSNFSTSLPAARGYLSSATDNLTAAINIIEAHDANYLLNLTTKIPEDIQKAKTDLAKFKTSLTGQVTFDATIKSTPYNNTTIDLTPFFAGLNLRNLLPPFTGDTAGLFPIPTFGGVIINGINMNQDSNDNGIPDILE